MTRTRRFFSRYRVVLAALAVSALAHTLVLVGVPGRPGARDEGEPAVYSATLELAPAAPDATVEGPPPAPAPKRTARAPHRPRDVRPPAPIVVPEPEAVTPTIIARADEPPPEAAPAPQPVAPGEPAQAPKPDVVALAQPAAPEAAPPPLPPAPEAFAVQGLPSDLSIDYQLTSAIADAHAVYNWSRDGDSYRITGEAEAVGFFQLFLDGSILQETRGTVTRKGLRPERFVEKKPGAQDEGLEFDWPQHTVTFERGDNRKSGPLVDNTVDWLSMIFQLAHVPPRMGAENLQIKVFTQRKLYNFDLKVLGTEEIEIPLGKVRALHLRHVDPDDRQVVDVWLGMDQHYLPVKMRYPIAKNRLMVEQAATRLTENR